MSGRFRITEQGEIITQNYAHPQIAERHLSIYTAALLYEKFLPQAVRSPSPAYRELMDSMARVSCEAYRSVVREHPHFIAYFRAATPELERANSPLIPRLPSLENLNLNATPLQMFAFLLNF